MWEESLSNRNSFLYFTELLVINVVFSKLFSSGFIHIFPFVLLKVSISGFIHIFPFVLLTVSISSQ